MILKSASAWLVLLAGLSFGQTLTTLNLSTQGHNPDFSNFSFTRPITVGSTLPATCQVGQMFFNSAAPAGQNIFGCTQPNVWAEFGILPTADSLTLGGITVPGTSGLLVSSGALSIAYGTAAHQALQGNTLGQPKGPASLDLNGNVPTSQLGNLGSAALLNASAFDGAGVAAAAVSAIPQSGPTVTKPALITPTDWAAFTNKQPALGFIAENSVNKNAKSGYAGLDSNGLFPWVQLSGVPAAGRLQSGILSASDWNTFSSKQAALGFTPENQANKAVAGGYASLNSTGQVPTTQLPIIPSKTSQLTNDAGFVNGSQAAAAAPVTSVNNQTGAVLVPVPSNVSQLSNDSGYVTASTSPVISVNGQTGAITVQAGNYQSVAVNSGVQTQAPTVNLKAGANVTLNGTYNSNTHSTDVSISASSGSGGTVTSGTSLPASNTCGSGSVGAFYEQTGANQHFFVCENSGSSYTWVPIDPQRGLSVMGFGCVHDGIHDDAPCIQAAINAASILNNYTQWDSANPYYGSDVYIPCGLYHVNSPIVLPRTNPVSYPNGPTNGVVGLIGESPTCTILYGTSGSGWSGVTGAYLTATGSGYSGTVPITFTGGGCTTEPAGAAILMSGTSNVAEVYTTSNGAGCTSMPSCTVGGSGSGAQCETLGHAVIEWVPIPVGTYQRTFGGRIKNIRFRSPSVAGTMGIHFQMSNTPNSGAGTCSVGYSNVCERMMNTQFENLDFEDDNTYNPASIAISGDCNTCTFRFLSNNPHQNATGYQTPLLMTSYWVDSVTDEGDGLFLAQISDIACGGEKVGAAPCFVGRAIRSSFTDMQCDGIHSSTAPAVCFALYNSVADNLTNLSVEGTAGVQFLIQNSKQVFGNNIGIGSGFAASGGLPAPYGLQLIQSSENHFTGTLASATNFATNGGFRVSMDSSSYKNEFFSFEIAGTNEISIANTGSNYFQYCVVGSCNANSNWAHLGTSPF